MHTSEIILIVAASTGLAAGVTMILMSIPEYYEQIQSLLEIISLVLGVAAIGIGFYIANRQGKQTAKMDSVVTNTSTMIRETHKRAKSED